MAAAHRAAGEFPAAIELYRAALADRERLQDPRHADTIAVRQKLGEAYLAAGQAKAAIGQYERVVSDRERVLGQEHLLTIAARGALGSAYHAAGKMASAVRLAERTRDEYAKLLGPDHPDTLAACVNLAYAYYSAGRVTDAAKLLRSPSSAASRAGAPDPLRIAAQTSWQNIGRAERTARRPAPVTSGRWRRGGRQAVTPGRSPANLEEPRLQPEPGDQHQHQADHEDAEHREVLRGRRRHRLHTIQTRKPADASGSRPRTSASQALENTRRR